MEKAGQTPLWVWIILVVFLVILFFIILNIFKLGKEGIVKLFS